MQSLSTKYRPKSFDDVVEQDSIKIILSQQIKAGEIQNAYLFVGGAGTGKTTCARIFANEINEGSGNPIELDAASNNGIDDVREIIQQAKIKPLNSKYKVFIIDECHALSNSAWQAMLKLIEEPPAFSIFVFCTTNPERIPKTILSRVQRYDFNRISQRGIVDRLMFIVDEEKEIDDSINWYGEALEYIAKIADGGMRDAITLLDKCLAYSKDVTLENVTEALGATNYSIFMHLTNLLFERKTVDAIKCVETVYNSGKDIKQFVKLYMLFLLDLNKYGVGCDFADLNIPKLAIYTKWLDTFGDYEWQSVFKLLQRIIELNAKIKYSSVPKYDLEAELLIYCASKESK